LGYRENGKGPYLWISYSDVIERTKNIGSGLINKGVIPENSTNIGIYSKNRVEVCDFLSHSPIKALFFKQWTVSEYACYSFSLNVISLYDSYGKDSIKYILNQGRYV
jgi:long-subunit acyl-CoA synthetase (AMP-forming)